MPEEYLLLGVAVRWPTADDYVIRSAARVLPATSPADAEAQALPWLAEELPPAEGWQDHALRVQPLATLRPAAVNEGATR